MFACLPTGRLLALEIRYPTIFGYSLNDTSSLNEFICYVIGVIMGVAFFISVIIIAYGGLLYLISYSRGKFTSDAKEWIKAGILGLFLVVTSASILYTINPELNKCKPIFLPAITINPGTTSSYPPGTDVRTFKEIPVGILTENLLTSTMNCYAFDEMGNPIEGDEVTTDAGGKIKGPTYFNKDRIECLNLLIEGAEKKAHTIATLSTEIIKLMRKCDCRVLDDAGNPTGESKCNPGCDPNNGGCVVQGDCPGGSCGGNCIGAGCTQPPATTDCCPDGVKNKIENGPIEVVVDVGSSGVGKCETEPVDFDGLDEFRFLDNGTPRSNIKNFVEIEAKDNGKSVLVNGKKVIIIKQNKWEQLNLLQQITYFKEKIDELKQKIRDDSNKLNSAKSTLASSQCYLTTPYVDLLKIYEGAQKPGQVILTEKAFTAPENGQVKIAKYCETFNYNNSTCLEQCNNACPDASPQAMGFYRGATNAEQLYNAYLERPCIFGKSGENFSSCINSCRNNCSNKCADKYLACSNEYKLCESQCQNNSKCALDESDKCLFNDDGFKYCADNATDSGNAQFCINNAYLCKGGGNEYSGFEDCTIDGNYRDYELNPITNSMEAVTNNCEDNFSASFLYQKPECQKCEKTYEPAKPNSACYASTNPDAACQDVCPETAKCPTSSKCPECSCDKIEETIKSPIPNTSTKNNATNPGYYVAQEEIKEFQMAGPQCVDYSFNDDPLTFYCESEWWNRSEKEGTSETPIGNSRICPKKQEIPVGQTVDNALNWAGELNNKITKTGQNIQNLIAQIIKIGEAIETQPVLNYCKCEAKYENYDPICKPGCIYSELFILPFEDNPGGWECFCNFEPCKGKPCDQVEDYLIDLWNKYKQFKNDFVDFSSYILKEPRSDIIKQLTYSRETKNTCSLTASAYGEEARLLNCTRVKDEIISPVNTGEILYNGRAVNVGCYGKDLGVVINKPLTDNWFCCEQWDKNEN